MKEDEIVEIGKSTKSSADVFNAISQIPTQVILSETFCKNKIESLDELAEYMTSFEFTITDHVVAELRKKHQVK